MPHPALEVAEIFRTHGAAWRAAHAGHISLGQLKVMSAIEACRTAALGGHVERCERCARTQIAYNSCLMGRSSNGELACRHRHFSVNCGAFCLHNSAVLRPVGSATDDRSQTETTMLETYFSGSKLLGHLRRVAFPPSDRLIALLRRPS